MSVPQLPPLLLLSEYLLITNNNAGSLTNINAIVAARLRDLIGKASSFITRECRRRFDERHEVRSYTSLDERVGGDLLGPFDLLLDDDLRAVNSVTNGDGQTLTNYKLLSSGLIIGGVNVYSKVHLNIYSGLIWRSGGNDPFESIKVDGYWGLGGQALDTNQALTTNLTATGGKQNITVTDGTQLEPGMLIKLTNSSTTPATIEYLFVDSIPTTSGGNVVVYRGYNNSAPAAWSSGQELFYWQAIDDVRDLVRRLVQWKEEQIKTPVSSTATVGDFSFPVNVAGLPTDLYLIVRDSGLIRVAGARAV